MLRLPLAGWATSQATLSVAALGWLPDGVDAVPLGEASLPLRQLAAAGSLLPPSHGAAGWGTELFLSRGGSVRISIAVRPLAAWINAPAEEPEEAAREEPTAEPLLPERDDGYANIELDRPSWLRPHEAQEDDDARADDGGLGGRVALY